MYPNLAACLKKLILDATMHIFKYTTIKEYFVNGSVGSRMAEIVDEMKQSWVQLRTAYRLNYLAFYYLKHLKLLLNKDVQRGTILHPRLLQRAF